MLVARPKFLRVSKTICVKTGSPRICLESFCEKRGIWGLLTPQKNHKTTDFSQFLTTCSRNSKVAQISPKWIPGVFTTRHQGRQGSKWGWMGSHHFQRASPHCSYRQWRPKDVAQRTEMFNISHNYISHMSFQFISPSRFDESFMFLLRPQLNSLWKTDPNVFVWCYKCRSAEPSFPQFWHKRDGNLPFCSMLGPDPASGCLKWS